MTHSWQHELLRTADLLPVGRELAGRADALEGPRNTSQIADTVIDDD
jgi:hypothetical protein